MSAATDAGLEYRFKTADDVIDFVLGADSPVAGLVAQYLDYKMDPEDVFSRGVLERWAEDAGYRYHLDLEDAWQDATDIDRRAYVVEWVNEHGVPSEAVTHFDHAADYEMFHDDNNHAGAVQFCKHPYCRQYEGVL